MMIMARAAGVEPALSAGQADVMSRYTMPPYGAAGRDRTRDFSVRSRVLYIQLRYCRNFVAPAAGLEPATLCLTGTCSTN